MKIFTGITTTNFIKVTLKPSYEYKDNYKKCIYINTEKPIMAMGSLRFRGFVREYLVFKPITYLGIDKISKIPKYFSLNDIEITKELNVIKEKYPECFV